MRKFGKQANRSKDDRRIHLRHRIPYLQQGPVLRQVQATSLQQFPPVGQNLLFDQVLVGLTVQSWPTVYQQGPKNVLPSLALRQNW